MKVLTHHQSVLLMICAATMWSSAGVLTRHLHSAHGVEVTFWRSVFAALFVAIALCWTERGRAVQTVRALGAVGLVSGLMWAAMFSCFMIALTMTTVANTLIVMSVSPLLTALLARLFLREKIAARTWLAIAVALLGMVWMFARGVSHVGPVESLGMVIALGVPMAASINVILLKKAGARVDLIPAVLVGGALSAAIMLPFIFPLRVERHDLAIMVALGVFQLGLPCMLMVLAARALAAPEIALLALIEVILGPVWAWLWAAETPASETLSGGALVIAALVFNELLALRVASAQAARTAAARTLP